MELYLVFLVPVLFGVLLAVLLHRLRHILPGLPFGQYHWPVYGFLAALGAAANNTAAVFFAGGDTFFPGGDNITALVTGVLMALFSASGLLASLLLRLRPAGQPGPLAAWVWSWVLTQGALACIILLLGVFVAFRTFPDGTGGLPLWEYRALVCLLCLCFGGFFGRHWGKTGGEETGRRRLVIPLAGGMAVCLAMGLLAAGMLVQARVDPTWGLDLIQTPAGIWYARLNLPAAVLLGEYQYAWSITPLGIWLSALTPHLLFTLGYLAPRIYRRGF